MSGVTWHYVLKFIITGESAQSVHLGRFRGLTEDTIVLQAMPQWASRRCLYALPTSASWPIRTQRSVLNVPMSRGAPLVYDELWLDVARSRVRLEADYHTGGREGGETSMYDPFLPCHNLR